MDIKYVSASELKRNSAEILNSVYYKKNTTIVEKFGKPIAKIIPIEEKNLDEKDISETLKKYFGSIPDFPDVTKDRRSRKRSVSL